MLFSNPEIKSINVSVDFEVRVEVQGSLHFLTLCKEEAGKLELSGWVKHTGTKGTVLGVIQGPKAKVQEMIIWLSRRNSPGIRTDRCSLSNYRLLSAPEYRGFKARF